MAVADRPAGPRRARVRLAAVDRRGHRPAAAAAPLRSRGEEVALARRRRGAPAGWNGWARSSCPRAAARPDPERCARRCWTGCARRARGCCAGRPRPASCGERLAFLHRVLGDAVARRDGRRRCWTRADEWLEPELSRPAAAPTWSGSTRPPRCTACCPWATGEAGRLDDLAPERIEVPSGSRIRVDYCGEQPVLAVKLQELFGLGGDAPRMAGVPVLVPPALPGRAPGGRHRRPGLLLARGLPRGPRRTARPLPQAPLAGGPADGRAAPTRRRPNTAAECGRDPGGSCVTGRRGTRERPAWQKVRTPGTGWRAVAPGGVRRARQMSAAPVAAPARVGRVGVGVSVSTGSQVSARRRAGVRAGRSGGSACRCRVGVGRAGRWGTARARRIRSGWWSAGRRAGRRIAAVLDRVGGSGRVGLAWSWRTRWGWSTGCRGERRRRRVPPTVSSAWASPVGEGLADRRA